jgi:hypothetical protein
MPAAHLFGLSCAEPIHGFAGNAIFYVIGPKIRTDFGPMLHFISLGRDIALRNIFGAGLRVAVLRLAITAAARQLQHQPAS